MSTGPIAVMYSRRTRRVALAEELDLLGQQLLQVRLDAVLDQAGVDAELVRRVVQDLVDAARRSRSSVLLAATTVHTSVTPSPTLVLLGSTAASAHGGAIQFSGL